MDNSVIAAMARWPDVPDVYGWLSLNTQGQWRLHPQGDALSVPDSPGTAISSPQILQFINRNYSHNKHGHWYFQNGPQRVYVRLDAAPFIFHTTGAKSATGTLALRSHNAMDAGTVQAWLLDDGGKLYAQTDLGPGLIAGRDLEAVLQDLHTSAGISVLDVLQTSTSIALHDGTRFMLDTSTHIPAHMGYVRYPAHSLVP